MNVVAPMRAVVLGGASWNTMIDLDSFPAPRPQTVFASGSRRAVGSSGAGKALNLVDLGAEARFWGLLGDDAEGAMVRAALEGAGVDVSSQLDPAGTMRHVNLMDRAGDRISIFEHPGTLDADPDLDAVRPLLDGADLVAITILEHCRPLLEVVTASGHDRWIDIHDYDGDNPYHGDFIEAATHLFLSSVALPTWRTFAEERITAGAQVVVCTHGADGASGLTAADGWLDVAATPVDRIVDTNGAGDAFFAGFATAFLGGAGLARSLEAGSSQAARVLQSPQLAPIR